MKQEKPEQPKKSRNIIRVVVIVAIGIFLGQVINDRIHIETYISSIVLVWIINATISVTTICVVDVLASLLYKIVRRSKKD